MELGATLVVLVVGVLALCAFLAGPLAVLQNIFLRRRVEALERERAQAGVTASPMQPPAPTAATTAPSAVTSIEGTTTTPIAPPKSEEMPPMPPAAWAPAGTAARDLATNLGPKIMAGVAAMFVVAALGFFVKYAWENNWVGPAGRVLGSAFFSLVLMALGTLSLRREYRPLGQALIAAGLSGLYVVSYAAFDVYGLVPRTVSFILMVAVTLAAVALAVRLDARLLAALAWVGAYLAPILVSTGEDRAETLFAYLVLVALGAVAVARRKSWPETLTLALNGTWLLYLVWFVTHFREGRGWIAASMIVAFTALFALVPGAPRAPRQLLTAAAILYGALMAVGLAGRSGWVVGAALTGIAVVATIAVPRFAHALFVGVVLAWAGVGLWAGIFHEGAINAGVALGTTVFLAYAVALVARSRWLAGISSGTSASFIVNSGAYWLLLYTLLYRDQPWLLTAATVGLAAFHLGLALVRGDAKERITLLALAAAFLTAAIPIRLGLNAITIAWALEGLVLLWLGTRTGSALARLGGYAVLAFAVVRLFVRHLPLHGEAAFLPIFNTSFAVWVFVAAAAFVALLVARSQPTGPERRLSRLALSAAGIVVLLVGATMEVHEFFDQAERIARASENMAAAQRSAFLGDLSISLLWGVFAATLLVVGLASRSRPLFYGAYALFAVAAAKVALVDLASLGTIYRIVSFFGLGVVLMISAFLILKFRHRLQDPPAASGNLA